MLFRSHIVAYAKPEFIFGPDHTQVVDGYMLTCNRLWTVLVKDPAHERLPASGPNDDDDVNNNFHLLFNRKGCGPFINRTLVN